LEPDKIYRIAAGEYQIQIWPGNNLGTPGSKNSDLASILHPSNRYSQNIGRNPSWEVFYPAVLRASFFLNVKKISQ
jgi:hypothetical protein